MAQLPGLQVVAVDHALGELALEIAIGQRIRNCDAVYVALAQRLDVGLITLDRQQRERVPHGVAAFTPTAVLTDLL